MTQEHYVSSFLTIHSSVIHRASLTSDELVIEFHDEVVRDDILPLFVDLINFCHPRKAQLRGASELRLEF